MKIRTLTSMTVLCTAAAVCLVPTIVSGSNSHGPAVTAIAANVNGVIEKYDAKANTFVLRTSDDKTMEFTVTKDTKYSLNGKTATKEEVLKVGMKATVGHEAGNATSVDGESG
jgi:hypothetical protein